MVAKLIAGMGHSKALAVGVQNGFVLIIKTKKTHYTTKFKRAVENTALNFLNLI